MTRRRKVVLYNPRTDHFTLPLGLLAVGSALDVDRFDVVIVDGRLEHDAVAAIAPHLAGAVCFGVGVLTGAPIRDALAVSRAVKAAHPELPVVWGGWHPSLFPEACLDDAAVDITVQGQGEGTFVEIVDRLAAGRSLVGCPGCTVRAEDGTAVVNPPRALTAFDDLPPLRHDLLPVERYFALKGRRQLDYIGSHGCFWRCAFCADPFVFRRRWVGQAADRLVATVAALWQRYRFDDLSFQDETFFTYAPRVEAITAGLADLDLPFTWAATMRADQGARLGAATWALLRRSRLRRLLVGVESGSQAMLDWMAKDITLEQVLTCAERCRAHGIAAQFPFIVGFPGEPDASVRASLDFAKRLRAMSPGFETPIFHFRPYPGSPITEAAVRAGYRLPTSLDGWADFDIFTAGTPWLTAAQRRHVERFAFYQRIAWGEPRRGWKRPLQRLARWRCAHDAYGLPIEMALAERLARRARQATPPPVRPPRQPPGTAAATPPALGRPTGGEGRWGSPRRS